MCFEGLFFPALLFCGVAKYLRMTRVPATLFPSSLSSFTAAAFERLRNVRSQIT